MNLKEEKELITALQSEKGSQRAYTLLIKNFKERLYWHIRYMVKNHEDTNDILQNVFIKVYRNIKKFKGDSRLYSWLYRIASNEAITFLNRKAKQQHCSSSELQNQLIQNLKADVYYNGDDIQLKLQRAIATLPNKQQQVFNMKYFEDLKYREISEILETSEGALKASYHLATKKIKAFLSTT